MSRARRLKQSRHEAAEYAGKISKLKAGKYAGVGNLAASARQAEGTG